MKNLKLVALATLTTATFLFSCGGEEKKKRHQQQQKHQNQCWKKHLQQEDLKQD